jgi:type IV secretory pathway TraG/TraD family ATPase VirD4
MNNNQNTSTEGKTVSTVNPLIEILTESGFTEIFYSPLGLLLLITVAGVVWGSFISGGAGSKHKLARARWAGSKEKKAARKQACKQMEARKHNQVALYISSGKVSLPVRVGNKYLLQIPKSQKRLYLPDVQRGMLVCGSPGSGKTYSVINPSLRSAIDQGFSIFLYDLKYHQLKSPTDKAMGQTAKLAGYALARGYKVWILAPGFKESCIANPLDFLQNESDAAMARQLAIVLNKNLKLSSGDNDSNLFFSNAGDLLTQGLFQIAKGTKYPDILMCFTILSLPNLITRLQNADLNLWTRVAFSQFLSVAQSPETAANIIGTALGLFTRFIIPEVLSCFCGRTNLPPEMTERQFVIFATDDERRDVIAPLIASVLHLQATHNLAKPRTTPLILSLDELPSIYLPQLASWLNQKRENGLCSILGLQNLAQLEATYGKENAESIFTGCVTKCFFNPSNSNSAETFSQYLGEEEITNSRLSRSSSLKQGGSTSYSLEVSKRRLLEASQFNTLPAGKAVIISPGFKSGQEVALPLLETIKLSEKVEKELETESVKLWYEYQQQFISQSQQKPITQEDLKVRLEEAERLLPLKPTLPQGLPQELPQESPQELSQEVRQILDEF